MPRLKKAHIVCFFENANEYCTFLKVIMCGHIKHTFVARATYPSIYGGRESGYIGYAEKYHGIYGDGWRIVIFRPRRTKVKGGYNHIVKYFIESNQIDRKRELINKIWKES